MISLVYGPNHYQIDQELAKLLEQPENVSKLDAESVEWNDVEQAISGLSLFDPIDSVVVLRGASNSSEIAQKLVDNIEQVPDSTHLVIVEPKIDKRSVLFKTLKQKAELIECPSPRDFELISWATQQAKSLGGELSSGDARLLVERVGENQQMLDSEIKKLIAYDAKISSETIIELVAENPRDTIFQMIDAISQGNATLAQAIYKNLRSSKAEPLYVVTMLGWHLQNLIALSAAKGRTDQEVTKALGVSSFVIQKSRPLANKMGLSRLRNLLKEVVKTDVELKTRSINADERVNITILKLTNQFSA